MRVSTVHHPGSAVKFVLSPHLELIGAALGVPCLPVEVDVRRVAGGLQAQLGAFRPSAADHGPTPATRKTSDLSANTKSTRTSTFANLQL